MLHERCSLAMQTVPLPLPSALHSACGHRASHRVRTTGQDARALSLHEVVRVGGSGGQSSRPAFRVPPPGRDHYLNLSVVVARISLAVLHRVRRLRCVAPIRSLPMGLHLPLARVTTDFGRLLLSATPLRRRTPCASIQLASRWSGSRGMLRAAPAAGRASTAKWVSAGATSFPSAFCLMTPAPTAAGLSGEWLFSSEKNYVYFLHDSWSGSFDGSPRFVTAKGDLLSISARSLARNLDIEMFHNSLKANQFYL